MNPQQDINAMAEAIRAELQARLGVTGRDLGQAVARAGRRLPRRVRIAAGEVIAAQRLGGNPRLALRIDVVGLAAAQQVVLDHLGTIDRAAARRDRLLALAGVIAFHLIVIFAAFVTWLWWRGHI